VAGISRSKEGQTMYCNGCGADVAVGSGFCGRCGRPVHLVPALPAGNRVANHITLLGALWVVYSIFTLIGGLMVFFIGKVMIAFMLTQVPPGGPPLFFLRPLLSIIGLLVIAKGAFGIAAGWGLLRREGWARTLAMILACISLIRIPFGTALGIYTLWVLMSRNGEHEYQTLAEQAGRI
jgi:hypothetical protein